MNIGPIIFISIIVLLIIAKLFYIYRKKEKTWDKLTIDSVVYWLYVNPNTGVGSAHHGKVINIYNDTINIESLGYISKKEFFNGKDTIEFLYL